MSLRSGDRSKAGQKHQNATGYKAGLHGRTKRMKEASSVALVGVCERCKDKIEWKRKYDKYKPLSVPKKCVLCQEKKVKQAYYRVCQECANGRGVCAKCGKEEVAESFPPTAGQHTREKVEFQRGLRNLRERERRSLLRVQARQEDSATDQGNAEAVTTSGDSDESVDSELAVS